MASAADITLHDKLRAMGISIPDIRPKQYFHPETRIEAPVQITKSLKWHTPLQVGAFSMIHGPGDVIYSSIGRYCSIAPQTVLGANEHTLDWLSTTGLLENPDLYNWSELGPFKSAERYPRFRFPDSLKRITIGHDVWIGQGVFIRGGVTIGHGAVIGARAVVTKDIPPYAIAGGVPAKVIRYRFSDAIIKQLLDLQWWNYSLYDIIGAKIDPREPQAAIDEIYALRDSGKLKPFEPEIVTSKDFETHATV